ncbi:DUF2721 domain-containing protein [Rhodovarius crocodyli]|uniref:DUF2721 domain-containing protein n=1 Tax=Rhodovarius crocodyli TaxID=1979269 RepID=A0A437ME95_9PROT|nr:DUF2721 domain-containing protein [Rhodovarius crocodyli]RVT95964.1 DUF2721 domain-containing protein [Rhodovarius crocodyli]
MQPLQAVEQAIGLALAPAFLLTAAMTALNALTTRQTRILDRMSDTAAQGPVLDWLQRRAHFARRAVQLAGVSALLVATQIMFGFILALTDAQSGTVLALLLVGGMLAFIAAMLCMLTETIMAERGPGL